MKKFEKAEISELNLVWTLGEGNNSCTENKYLGSDGYMHDMWCKIKNKGVCTCDAHTGHSSNS